MLTIKHLSKRYPNGVHALNDINLSIPVGMFGLLGPNGAGKSSLMRTLATLQDADEGSILLDDLDLLSNKEKARPLIGYLPQDFGLYPQLTAFELLDHLAVLKGLNQKAMRHSRVDEMLELTNLWDKRHHQVGTFSGGMRQRFGIAQALIASPRLLIVDEPTAGLDPTERNRFHNLLVRISGDMVVLLSTHIVEDVGDLCANMAVMNKGQVLCKGTPTELKEQLNGRIWSKRLTREETLSPPKHLQIISTRLTEGLSDIHVLSNDSPGQDFETLSPDLEDVYFTTLYEHAEKQNQSNRASGSQL